MQTRLGVTGSVEACVNTAGTTNDGVTVVISGDAGDANPVFDRSRDTCPLKCVAAAIVNSLIR